jgi:hypothetical protein
MKITNEDLIEIVKVTSEYKLSKNFNALRWLTNKELKTANLICNENWAINNLCYPEWTRFRELLEEILEDRRNYNKK